MSDNNARYEAMARLPVYAMDKSGLWFTTTTGHAYEAAAIKSFKVIKPEPTLFD